jgi:hypothetical protein
MTWDGGWGGLNGIIKKYNLSQVSNVELLIQGILNNMYDQNTITRQYASTFLCHAG